VFRNQTTGRPRCLPSSPKKGGRERNPDEFPHAPQGYGLAWPVAKPDFCTAARGESACGRPAAPLPVNPRCPPLKRILPCSSRPPDRRLSPMSDPATPPRPLCLLLTRAAPALLFLLLV